MFAGALLLALDRLVYMHVSCIDSDVHSGFELCSALSQSSWIRCYIIIRVMYYYYRVTVSYHSKTKSVSVTCIKLTKT